MKSLLRWPVHLAILGALLGGLVMLNRTTEAQTAQKKHNSQSQQQMTLSQDKYIGDRVERRLIRSASLAGTDIRVAVENRVVSLSGTVGSEQDKERALQLARKTKGVKDVKDELSIDREAVQQRRDVQISDEALAKQVATALVNETFPMAKAEEEWLYGWEVEGPNWAFSVEADDRIITLEGTVDNFGDMSDALQTARSVSGVRAVDAELEVNALKKYGAPYFHPYGDVY